MEHWHLQFWAYTNGLHGLVSFFRFSKAFWAGAFINIERLSAATCHCLSNYFLLNHRHCSGHGQKSTAKHRLDRKGHQRKDENFLASQRSSQHSPSLRLHTTNKDGLAGEEQLFGQEFNLRLGWARQGWTGQGLCGRTRNTWDGVLHRSKRILLVGAQSKKLVNFNDTRRNGIETPVPYEKGGPSLFHTLNKHYTRDTVFPMQIHMKMSTFLLWSLLPRKKGFETGEGNRDPLYSRLARVTRRRTGPRREVPEGVGGYGEAVRHIFAGSSLAGSCHNIW